jgi:O-antigen ligase
MGQVKSRLISIISFGLLTITLVVTPLTSYDPINLPKFIALNLLTFPLISLLIIYRKELSEVNHKLLILISLLFIAWSLIALIVSPGITTELWLGVSGRHTGFLTYTGLVVLMLAAVVTGGKELNKRIFIALVVAGTVSLLFAYIQIIGADPFDWITQYTPVFSVFGNPNFLSSFMAITITASFVFLLDKVFTTKHKCFAVLYIPLAIYVIYKSQSQQGYLVTLIGLSTLLFLRLISHKKFMKLWFAYLCLWITGGTIAILDMLQKTPWESVLYKQSVSFRGDFWQAGWRMALDKPIFGFGLDGYRDHFRRFRDDAALLRDPVDAEVDSAHNVFLDILTGGGFPLLAIYLIWIVLVFISAIKVFKRESEFNPYFAGLFAVWISYLAQSVISINTISLAIWGWCLGGAIVGYEISMREDKLKTVRSNRTRYLALKMMIPILLSMVLSVLIFTTDSEFKAAHRSGDVLRIMASHDRWPQDVRRMNVSAQILREAGFPDQALVISRKSVKFNPDNYESWKQFWLMPNITESEKRIAEINIRRLDPLSLLIK